MHVDALAWGTAGDGRALWTLTTPGAALFQIAEHCNREQFQALIGPYPGIIVSDRWNGYEHLDPRQRQVCWSHIQRDFRRHSEGLAEQKIFGQHGLELTRRVFTAWRAYQHAHHNREQLTNTEIVPLKDNYDNCSNTPARKADAPAGIGGSRTTCSSLARALDLRRPRGRRADQQPRRTRAPRPRHPPKTLPRHQQQTRRTFRRTRPVGRRDLPPAKPLTIRVPPRTTRRPQPRRPLPRAHLSQGPGTERLPWPGFHCRGLENRYRPFGRSEVFESPLSVVQPVFPRAFQE